MKENRVVEVYYEVQSWISPEIAIGGVGYWNPVQLLDGKKSTPNLEYAKMCYGAALGSYGEENVRLVQVETKVIA